MPKACPYVLMEICVVFKLVVDVGWWMFVVVWWMG